MAIILCSNCLCCWVCGLCIFHLQTSEEEPFEQPSSSIIRGVTIITTWVAMGTTMSTGSMGTFIITQRITLVPMSIPIISSWWVRRVMLLTCQKHMTWIKTTKLRGALIVYIALSWELILITSQRSSLWNIVTS